jgi:hypothetical protein
VVTVKINNVTVVQTSVPLKFFTLGVPALTAGDAVLVESSLLPGCAHGLSAQWTQIMVGGAAPAPQILPPLCQGQSFVDVGQLRVGALVQLKVTGQNTHFFGASASNFVCPTQPLPFPGSVQALQNTCGGNQWIPSINEPVTSLVPVQTTLFAPPDGTQGEMLQPTLVWEDLNQGCNEAKTFDIEISTDPALAANVVKFYGVISPNQWLNIKNNLAYSTTYHWRVRGNANNLTGPWSVPFKFTTIPQPTAPNQPNDDDVVRDRYFVEDCCPFFRKVIVVNGTHDSAYAKAVAQAASNCTIDPLEVDKDFQVSPC